jgi:hypothetical protein
MELGVEKEKFLEIVSNWEQVDCVEFIKQLLEEHPEFLQCQCVQFQLRVLDEKVVQEIREELSLDSLRFDSFESWKERVFDYPSNMLLSIFEKIPKKEYSKYWGKVNEIINEMELLKE